MTHLSRTCNLLIIMVWSLSIGLAKPSDISHFIFYYKTDHYSLDASSQQNIIYNEALHMNITTTPHTLWIHEARLPMIQLEITNDDSWDEISSIQAIHTTFQPPQTRSSRLLLQLPPPPPGAGGMMGPPPMGGMGPPPMGGMGAPPMGAPRKPLLKVYTGARTPTNYQGADAGCRALGSVLATAVNHQQNNNIMKECNKYGANVACWIGLKAPFMAWADGQPVGFKSWAPGQPKNDGTGGECVEIYPDGKWGATSCESGRSAICQKIEQGLPSVTSGAPAVPAGGGGGGGGCHRGYGCGGGGGGRRKSPCAASPCAKIRQKEEQHDRRMKRRMRRRKRERRVRAKWRLRLRRLRARKDRKLKRALQTLKRKHEREGATYSWIADLLQRKILAMQDTGQIAGPKGKGPKGKGPMGKAPPRRRMIVMDDDDNNNNKGVMKRCKVMMRGRYDVCLVFNRQNREMELDIRYMEKRGMKTGDHGTGYREAMEVTQRWFDEEYRRGHEDDTWVFNPIEASVGYVMDRYEDKETHFGDYIHYFTQWQFDLDGVDKQCSVFMDYLPFKLCLKRVSDDDDRMDVVLYFEKDGEDEYKVDETYSFQVKEWIDDGFESNVFSFNDDNDWDEINVVNNKQLVTKCTHKLLIAKACIQQAGASQYSASITFKAKNTKRDKP